MSDPTKPDASVDFRKRSACTPEEALRYLSVYFATVDLVSEALGKFQILAADATTVSQRSLYRAKALEAERDLELLKNQRRAFLQEEAAIRPPSEAVVAESEKRAQALANVAAKEAKATSVVKLLGEGITAFTRLGDTAGRLIVETQAV
ncbi:hypothetical protein EIP75_23670 [Aquabacterium soli]|uniref:Uncharacterized protein n=1 Tax=Aquabacterium soli TaxID=2493092 RepID=A0A3R8RZC7_9BURK|nr:hypothetical protein [Aquabacterium soli]RRR99888.1 hypothetical protein EIP75_23670 [Aquabacterium soli]